MNATIDRLPITEKPVWFITGCSTGFGNELARQVLKRGYRTVITARRPAAVAALADLGDALVLGLDVTEKSQVEAAVRAAEAHFGRIDVLVNNAGARGRGRLEDVSDEDWDRVVTVNLKGVFLASVAVLPTMREQSSGVIVNIAGASAHRSYPLAGAYGPSKAAVVSLTKQMALEWAAHGIRVNGVSPGPIREPDSGWEASEPRLVSQAAKIPLRRVGTPEDVAHAVVYLASPRADYVTGHMLLVDGGSAETWYVFP